MAFTPRSFDTILTEMVAFVRANSTVSDFTIGSAIRTILEAAALEDDEQYFQMVQLLDAFSLFTAKGSYLDERLKDYNITRLPAKSASGKVRYEDTNAVTSSLAIDLLAGGTSLIAFSTEGFPVPSPSYVVRVAEGTSRVTDLTVITHTSTANTLVVNAPTTLDYFAGDRVTLVTGAIGRSINAGDSIMAPATTSQAAIVFVTQRPAYISPGNYYSTEVPAKAVNTGPLGNVAVGRISKFTSSAPFSGAVVSNVETFGGGTSIESDAEFLIRGLQKIQALSRGTKLALKANSVGVEDPNTGSRVTSSSVQEDFINDEVRVFVDDGTGFVPDTLEYQADNVSGAHLIGAILLTVSDASDFPTSGFVYIRGEGSNVAELVAFEGKSLTDPNALVLVGSLTSNHADGALVHVVDVLTESSEAAQRRFRLNNFPVVRNSETLLKLNLVEWEPLTRDTDYLLNKGNGELEMTDVGGLATGTKLIAYYTYYTNLIAEVQKVLEGDGENPVAYPGVKAAGIHLSVEAPTIKRVTVQAVVTAEDGFTEVDISPDVVSAIESYINSRNIGEDIIHSKIITAAGNVPGVKSIRLIAPTNDITVLEDERPLAASADGTTLVTVL